MLGTSLYCVAMRKLKYHEQKLLKKVDFLQWKSDQNIREIQVRKGKVNRGKFWP